MAFSARQFGGLRPAAAAPAKSNPGTSREDYLAWERAGLRASLLRNGKDVPASLGPADAVMPPEPREKTCSWSPKANGSIREGAAAAGWDIGDDAGGCIHVSKGGLKAVFRLFTLSVNHTRTDAAAKTIDYSFGTASHVPKTASAGDASVEVGRARDGSHHVDVGGRLVPLAEHAASMLAALAPGGGIGGKRQPPESRQLTLF